MTETVEATPQPARTSDGKFAYATGTEARADAVLAKILGTPAPGAAAAPVTPQAAPSAPQQNTAAAPVAAPVEPQGTPAPVADETLIYAGFTPSMQAKLSPEERIALVAHHKAENAKAKQQAERLNELEKLRQTPAVEAPAPQQGRAVDFTKADESIAKILGLSPDELPTVAEYRESIVEAVRAENASKLSAMEAKLVMLTQDAETDIVTSTMKVLGERFPQLTDAAVMARVRANVDRLRQSPHYATCAPTAKERALKLWEDGCKLADVSPVTTPDPQARDSARNAGQVTPSQTVVAPKGETPEQRIHRLAMKYATF